jgi:hypothetical protein
MIFKADYPLITNNYKKLKENHTAGQLLIKF